MYKLILLALAILTITSAPVTQGSQRKSAQKYVGRYDAVELKLPAISAPRDLALGAYMVARAAAVPLGVEVLPARTGADPRIRSRPAPPTGAVTVLTGLSVGAAFDALVKAAPDYEWSEAPDGVINLYARSLQSPVLTRVIPEFRVDGAGVVEVMTSIHRLFDPEFTVRNSFSSTIAANADEAAQSEQKRREDQAKPITIILRNASVREILNAVAVAHGTITWEVSYARAPAEYSNCKLAIHGFNGWSAAIRARGKARSGGERRQ